MKKVCKVIDVWLCHTRRYNLETMTPARKWGVEDWFYGPMIYEKDENRFAGTSSYMDLPLVVTRGMSWVAWKYRTSSWCLWEFDYNAYKAWYDPESFKDYFVKEGGIYRNCQGNGMLIYRGKTMGIPQPVASIRLKSLRSGVQEYEYLRILSRLADGARIADRLVNRLVYKPLGEQSIGNLNPLDLNPLNWDAARIRLGKTIHRLVCAK